MSKKDEEPKEFQTDTGVERVEIVQKTVKQGGQGPHIGFFPQSWRGDKVLVIRFKDRENDYNISRWRLGPKMAEDIEDD